jgi:hypothetical protein
VFTIASAYIWVGDFEAAWRHLYRIEQDDSTQIVHPKNHAMTYELAGAAKWCLGDRGTAVAQWRAGLKCAYSDGAGGAKPPLLLYFAAVVDEDLFPRAEAEKLLVARADDPRSRNWPGPIARYIVGRVDAEQLRNECFYNREAEMAMREMTADFYLGVVERLRGNHKLFADGMNRVASITWDDFDRSQLAFVARVRQAEFALACCEARRLAAKTH